jgi:predicted aspartyl protease
MRNLLVGALLAALVLPQSGVAQSYDAATLLALHHKYVGWQFGDGTFTTLRESGTISDDAAASAKTYFFVGITMGAIYRDVTIDPATGSPLEDGFTGRVFWESDENGFTRPDYSPRQALNISQSVLFNEGTSELSGTLEPATVIDGASYPGVRIQPPNGDPIDLYVDPATGAYVRAVLDPGGPYERTIDILTYADALPGKKVISKYRDGHWTFSMTKVEPNLALTPSDFHPPAQSATWDFANPNPFAISVKPHAIFVDASINGIRGRFLIDTGAAGIYVNNAFADRAHLATITTGTASGIGPNQVHLRVRRADTLSIGGNTLHNVLIDTAQFDWHEDNEQPDGLIGYPLFAGAIVTLSTLDQTMQISDPSTISADTSHGLPIRVDLQGGVPVVPMTIDNRVTANALFDTGDGGFVALSQELVTKRGIPMMAHAYTGNAFYHPEDPSSMSDYVNSHVVICGVGGCETEACSTVSSISIGPITYQSTYACISPSLTSDDLIVGYDFLRNFDFVFDYRDGILVLKPHPQ